MIGEVQNYASGIVVLVRAARCAAKLSGRSLLSEGQQELLLLAFADGLHKFRSFDSGHWLKQQWFGVVHGLSNPCGAVLGAQRKLIGQPSVLRIQVIADRIKLTKTAIFRGNIA